MSWNIGLQDKIGTVSHSVGVISLQSSLLTLGGRQYQTGILSRTISADVTLAANTLYFVYAQVVSGVAALRVSASAPSIYRVANPTAKIVGSFVSNYASSFGVFLEINTRQPTLNGRAFTGTVNIPNANAMIVSGWSGGSVFFDTVNGFFRPPISGYFNCHATLYPSLGSGAANTLTSNIYMLGGIKPTAPLSALDAVDNFGSSNGPWFSSTQTARAFQFDNTIAAGSYVWAALQSNLHPEVLDGAAFTYNLLEIPVAIQDM